MPKEVCDISYKSIRSSVPNKRKKVERNLPPSVNDGGGTGEGDVPNASKHVFDSLNNRSEYDLSFLSETNKYDKTSQGPFDVVLSSDRKIPRLQSIQLPLTVFCIPFSKRYFVN